MIRIARLTTAPCSSPNDRIPPASALIGVARVDAIVRATSADGASGPWSIAATRQAPSSSASASEACRPPQAQQHRRERHPADGLVQRHATDEHPLSVVAVMAVDHVVARAAARARALVDLRHRDPVAGGGVVDALDVPRAGRHDRRVAHRHVEDRRPTRGAGGLERRLELVRVSRSGHRRRRRPGRWPRSPASTGCRPPGTRSRTRCRSACAPGRRSSRTRRCS